MYSQMEQSNDTVTQKNIYYAFKLIENKFAS